MADKPGGFFSMSQKSIFDADVAAVETELPAQLRFGGAQGTVIIASRVPVNDAKTMEDAGFLPGFDVEVDVRVSAFATASLDLPNVRDEVEVYEISRAVWLACKIEKIMSSQDGVMLHLSLNQST